MEDKRDAVGAWIHALDNAWNHKWESLEHALRGVTDEEANWQHAAYAGEPQEAGWPKPGTIAWHVAHLAHCKEHYARVVRARGTEERPKPHPRVPVASFADEIAALQKAHTIERDAISEVTDEEMHFGVGTGNPMDLSEFLAMIIRHDSWHGGQIAVIRRLYRTQH